jgi:succinoglycan biosynthesis protein ExoO
MLVSVIIPACAAEATIARCVGSLLAQSYRCWEAVIVADDRQDYAAILAKAGIVDRRLRFVSTGAVRSGCHNARNIGMSAAAGEIIAHLDADDLYDHRRLAVLVPLAAAHGAAVDAVAVVSDATGELLYTAPRSGGRDRRLSATALLDLGVPLFPVMRRDAAAPRLAGVEYAEDVIANLRLIDELGPLPLYPHALYQYRVVAGSLCHDETSAAHFEAAYCHYLARLLGGDAFDLTATRRAAQSGLARKRAANRLFAEAQRRRPALTFQDFMAGFGGSVSRALASAREAAADDGAGMMHRSRPARRAAGLGRG